MMWVTVVIIYIEISNLVGAQFRRSANIAEDSSANEPVPVLSVQGVAGQRAALPCEIQSRNASDAISMVLWFKENNSGEPLYSYDARNRQSGKAKLWSATHYWGNRASFRANPPAQLVIQDLRESDEGVYRCRVDFRNSPTKNVKVNFAVILPPSKPIIYDAKRRDMSKLLEAYPEGADLNLVCEVHGGRPRPAVVWYLESQIIDSTYEVRENRGSGSENNPVTINHVTVKSLTRNHHHARLSCKANNTHLAQPPTTTVVIELNMKPLTVEIVDKDRILSVGKTFEIECRSTGSKPPAILTWWRASKQLKSIAKNFQDGSMSVSVLQFEPSTEDEGKFLACRAQNPRLSEPVIEDRWKLKIHFRPIVTLKMGSSLNPERIVEGDDVYFECNVKANPRAYKLAWFHEGEELRRNVTGGIVFSDHSLVLQGITKEAAGRYTCSAVNIEGRETSNDVEMKIMYAPICKHVKKTEMSIYQNMSSRTLNEELHGVLKHETVNLLCEVEANPTSVTFLWTFNNSGDLNDIPSTWYTNEGTISRLNYTPESDMDYGTLGCWAKNLVGSSKQPCLYQVIAAGKPYPLQNCTVQNINNTWIRISCIEGFDGGLPQKFFAVIDKKRLESNIPYWEFELQDSTKVSLYAINLKGTSDPVVLDSIILKDVAKFTSESTSSVDMSPILIGLGGTATGLGLIVTGVLMALWKRHAATPSKAKPSPQQPTVATFTAGKPEEEDGNPDLIPTTVLINHVTDRKLPIYGSLPRRPHQLEGRESHYDILEDYHRASQNTYYSLQRPTRCSETMIRNATIQESCI